MFKKTKYKLGALLLFLATVAAGCGSSGGGTSNKEAALEFWGVFETTDDIQDFINAYGQKNPRVTISYTKKSIETYQSDLINALAAGTGPDIYAIHNDWLPKYQDKLIEAPDKTFTYKTYKDAFVDVAVEELTVD